MKRFFILLIGFVVLFAYFFSWHEFFLILDQKNSNNFVLLKVFGSGILTVILTSFAFLIFYLFSLLLPEKTREKIFSELIAKAPDDMEI